MVALMIGFVVGGLVGFFIRPEIELQMLIDRKRVDLAKWRV